MTPTSSTLDLRVVWDDRTPYGGLMSNRLMDTVRQQLHPFSSALLVAQMERPPLERQAIPTEIVSALVREERRRLRYRRITSDPDFWRPPTALTQPCGLVASSDGGVEHLRMAVSAKDFASASLGLNGTGEPPWPMLALLGRESQRSDPAAAGVGAKRAGVGGATFVGHACVSMTDGEVRLWTDPFLRPKRPRYGRVQPLWPSDFQESRHAVLITHSHPDHFDPGSLLRFPRDTVVLLPKVEAETILSLDLAYRARQLGFTDVRPLEPGDVVQTGGFTITALPFHGEQPLGFGAVTERQDRAVGLTYHVADLAGRTALFLADTGADPWMPAATWARAFRRRLGPVDVLFANHRTWRLRPTQFLPSSMPQFLLFAPDDELDRAQRIMLSPEDLRDVAEILEAKTVVPYAMGAAPWFTELGFGFEHTRKGRNSFDAAPMDVFGPNDPECVVKTEQTTRILQAGQSLDEAPEAPLRSGRRPAGRPTLSISIENTGPELVAALLELTRIDPRACLVASPYVIELATAASADAALLISSAAQLAAEAGWSIEARSPFCFGTFADDALWRRLFLRPQARATVALRDGGDLTASVRDLLRRPPLAAAPCAVLGQITSDLLGFTPDLSGWRPRSALPRRAPPLPPASTDLVAEHGADAVAVGLLAVKLVHNVFVTASAVGCAPAETGSLWFAQVF